MKYKRPTNCEPNVDYVRGVSGENGSKLPLVSFPAFAIESVPGPACLSLLEGCLVVYFIRYSHYLQVLVGKPVTVDRLK